MRVKELDSLDGYLGRCVFRCVTRFVEVGLGHILHISWRAYKLFVSPLLPNSCRFYPTCSHYALLSFQSNSKVCAILLVIFRLLRCQPFSNGGINYPIVRIKHIFPINAISTMSFSPNLRANKQALFANHICLNHIRYWLIPLRKHIFFMDSWFLLVPHLRSI